MIKGKRVCVVMPAYNAAQTLEKTYGELPHEILDDVILVDDASRDETTARSRSLGIHTITHSANKGYGGNQKTCYRAALERGADIVIMLHPDYQYDPKLVGAMAWMLASGDYDAVLASRILGGKALKGGMPLYKYVANRFLTAFQNLCVGAKLSEYHSGYRGFTRRLLETVPIDALSNDFIFDNEMLMRALYLDFVIGEISCPTRYEPESSSINFKRSCIYGFGCVKEAVRFRLVKWRVLTYPN
ncbi:MAG TPA: glycosyltransferase family 2 protein [Fimbriimonas sp.]|nr:glycosyltransferase family 2 protein [Fimbriimonas sp.]